MKNIIRKFKTLPIGLALLAFVACNIISGTFVVTVMYYDEDLSSATDYYYLQVDVTEEEDWQDHEDEIKDIDNIGFELWMDNNSGAALTAYIYVAPVSSSLNGSSSRTAVIDSAIQVLKLPVANSDDVFIGYAESFQYVGSIDDFRDLAEEGRFKLWAMSDASPIDFDIDSAKVIVTVSAGK